MSRGQVATEFFIYSSMFLIAVLIAYFAIFFVQSAEISNKESLYMKLFGERFASHINTAMSGQNGMNYSMSFDPSLMGKPYRVYFKPANSSLGTNGFAFIANGNNLTYSYPIGNMQILDGGGCIITHASSEGAYYEINTSRRKLSFYNDGENITLSQGCT